ncbi:malonyl CoA-acyl carrier protein transacylase [Elysia marginata]|uniref:[acyl-carrier-protein] S-malonyltransferase n=1 Tax=Elysia marginata TaxID=1093978 RepID=A0AAV4FWN6_9GAST|nr:malonyl CoA-acyl carrier protein transacylase [Elysia marginata]
MRAYVFPGQGAQFSGMGRDLYETHCIARDLFDQANDILGFSISDIMFFGTDEDLKQTKVTQPAVFLHSVILSKVMGDKFDPDMVAGHSLGEVSALTANGVLPFENGLQLVHKRALAMQKACEINTGTMAAILGLEDKIVEDVCASIEGCVVAANYNCPDQLVISGEEEAVDKACEELKVLRAKRTLKLPVGGAFHSPLMESAREELAEAIERTTFNKPICPIYQNVNAIPATDIEGIKKNLIAQLTAPVLWTQTILNMDKINPWLIGLEVNTIAFTNLSKWRVDVAPSISFFRHSQEDISYGIRYSQNTISTGEMPPNNIVDYRSIEFLSKFNLNRLTSLGNLDPYVSGGLGITSAQNINTLNTLIELGANYWTFPRVGINLHISYKHDFQDKNLGAFQYLGGLVIRFGGKDSDGDGTYDKIDICPDLYGIPYLRGCPDYDNDGVEDIKDECPKLPGLPENAGCPDTDSDGVTDEKDDCPSAFGIHSLNGCPDTDYDGLRDIDDKCPEIKGMSENNGCPWPDRDNDFVPDKDDKCPDIAGYVATTGCPEEFSQERQKQLNEYAKTILFGAGTSKIRKDSEEIVLEISFILKEFPSSEFIIEGHTDSIGDEKLNQKLSEERAGAVLNALIELGIDAHRLKATGYGELRPVRTNSTESGRRSNRRVEINLVK